MGCQPSSIVSRLLSRFHLLPVPPQRIVVPTGPLLHRVLAGEDVRAELSGGMRVLPAEEQVLPHRIPIARRRFDEVSPDRVDLLKKQAPWKLQAFNFDPAPTPATWAAWDQARVFHRQVFPHPQHPAHPSLSFREKLKAEDVRNYRRQLRDQDAGAHERSAEQKAQDLEDDAVDAFFLREKMQAAGFQPVLESDRITITSAEQYEKDLEIDKLAFIEINNQIEQEQQQAIDEGEAEAEEITEGEEIADESLIEGEDENALVAAEEDALANADEETLQFENELAEAQLAQEGPRTPGVRSPSEKRAAAAAASAPLSAEEEAKWVAMEAQLLDEARAQGLDPDAPLEELLDAISLPKPTTRARKSGIAGKKKPSKKEVEEDDE